MVIHIDIALNEDVSAKLNKINLERIRYAVDINTDEKFPRLCKTYTVGKKKVFACLIILKINFYRFENISLARYFYQYM